MIFKGCGEGVLVFVVELHYTIVEPVFFYKSGEAGNVGEATQGRPDFGLEEADCQPQLAEDGGAMLPAVEFHFNRRALGFLHFPQAAKYLRQMAAIGEGKDSFQSLKLIGRGAIIQIEPALPVRLAHETIAPLNHDHVQAVERRLAKLAFLDVPGAIAFAETVGGRLARIARADEFAVAGLEVEAGEFPRGHGYRFSLNFSFLTLNQRSC